MYIWVENTFLVTVLSGKFRYLNCHYRSFASPTPPHTNILKHKLFYYVTHTTLKRSRKCGYQEGGCLRGLCRHRLKWRRREATRVLAVPCFSVRVLVRVLVMRVYSVCELLLCRCNRCLTDGHRSCDLLLSQIMLQQ